MFLLLLRSVVPVLIREISEEPYHNRADKYDSAHLLKILSSFLPSVSEDGLGCRHSVWRKFHYKRKIILIDISDSFVTAEGDLLYGISASGSVSMESGTLISSGKEGAIKYPEYFTENINLVICAGNSEDDAELINIGDLKSTYHYVKIEVKPVDDSCTITFDSNGGTGSMGSATVSAGESYTLPDCTFTAPDGQVFKAWLIGSAEYAAGTSYTPSDDVTAYAVWVDSSTAPSSFSITYPSNGAVLTSTDTIDVTWTAADGATSYLFTLRDLTISEDTVEGKVIPDTDIGNVLTYTIDSTYLIDGHNYRVAVCAVNDAGNIWQNAEFSINTQALLAGVPTMQLPSASGVYYTGNDITVTWTAPATNPDSYTIWLYGGGNDAVSFTGITGDTYTIPGSNFANAGSYSVEVYAIKEGYLQDKPGNVLFEVLGEQCIHENTNEVDVNSYLGISKSFPMCDGDQHYWYVNEVCTDCSEIIQSNVKKYASHNAIVNSDTPGICECNYYPTEWTRGDIASIQEDTDTYLIPEANYAYKGGSLNKGEEYFVLSAENLGGYKDWNLIEYSVSGTDRTKIRFVKVPVKTDVIVPISFRASDEGVIKYYFSYSDSYFTSPSTEYNHDLAKISLGLAAASFTHPAADVAGYDGYAEALKRLRITNIEKAYVSLGFDTAEYYNYDVPVSDSSNKVAYSIAKKEIDNGNVLYVVVPRGGGYGGVSIEEVLQGLFPAAVAAM